MARPVGPRGQGRARVLDAALELFAEHGVSGTSLQMIADHLGVTKAAVYYQFQAKEEIVLAVLEPAMAQMATVVAVGEAAPTDEDAAELTVQGLVDLMIDHRKVVAALSHDPEVGRVMESNDEFRALTERLGQLLTGPDPDPRRRVATSVIGAGLAQAGTDPTLDDVDDDVLRVEMLRLCRLLLDAGVSGRP
jgi:AcrR family transcriptional regulator